MTLFNPTDCLILVVDDLHQNLQVMGRILELTGYKTSFATNGKQALSSVHAIQPDLILLDLMMPEMNGLEVCEKLKENSYFCQIPIIFLTASNDKADLIQAFKKGAADYITKPFKVAEVLARVENQLSLRSLQKQLQQQAETLQDANQRLQTEIMERQFIEERLMTYEKRIRTVFEAIPDISIIIHIQDRNIGDLEVLPTHSICSDLENIEQLNQTIEQFFHAKTATVWFEIADRALKTKNTINYEYSLNINNQNKWFTATISPFEDSSVIFVARDISDVYNELRLRKQAEEALQLAEQSYRSIVENAIEGIYQSTPDGRYINVNSALARIYGYSSREALMESIINIDTQLYVNQNRRSEFRRAIEIKGEVSGFESMIYCQDRRTIWISETVRVVRDTNGKTIYYEGIVSDITERKVAQEALKFQHDQTELLLLNILPPSIAVRLQSGENPIADHIEEVSVLFADLVGFTEFSSCQTPIEIVVILNTIFSDFDQLAQHYGLEKIKTIGDAYMVVGGLPTSEPTTQTESDSGQSIVDIAARTAKMALDMQQSIIKFNSKWKQTFQLRIGIHCGSVVAGVIGISKFSYDLWGDTVNVASRMESTGSPGKIQVTGAFYDRLKHHFVFEQRSAISVKGKGEMLTYWLISSLDE
ncbi:adenylate/guanylate cyclase domain-containing protein [Limnofasciculus baicalensis]|uniref:Adenylate cyclase n=1 Tax=Limnofasciculus baicalensis BBK-W-15 TaxID=2699891 RepID=A0AAE3GVB5_9CYAN|nr:adenylate/guanylate cyclase domain-containing protein [Limnofasciculus baicalensis]MCP2731351.1 response regulator [Limnofasciculus baicalensis BBK-W-15]